MKIPDGYQAVMPYLIINNAAGFIDFAKDVFNAELTHKTMRENETDIIRHAEITINNSTIMCADTTPQFPPATSNLFVYVDNADETFVKAKAAGATVLMELSDQPYGRTCGVTDPAGNVWWITSVK